MSTNDIDLLNEFIDASVLDQPKALLLLQKYPWLLHARLGHGETALHFLAIENFPEGIRFLAQVGADVNTRDEAGTTPLINAVILDCEEVVRILLSLGANPNATSVIHDNALHCAISSGNTTIVDALLQAGANTNYCTELGDTLFSAIPEDTKKRKAIAAVLSKYGIVKER